MVIISLLVKVVVGEEGDDSVIVHDELNILEDSLHVVPEYDLAAGSAIIARVDVDDKDRATAARRPESLRSGAGYRTRHFFM